MWVWSLGQEDPLEKGMTAHSSILAWRIPRTKKPGRLRAIGLQRVKHDWSNLACMPAQVTVLKADCAALFRAAQSSPRRCLVVVFRQLCCVFWTLLSTLLRQQLMIICDTLTRGRRSHSLFIFDRFLFKIFVLASLKFNLFHFYHKYIKKKQSSIMNHCGPVTSFNNQQFMANLIFLVPPPPLISLKQSKIVFLLYFTVYV